MAQQAAGGGAAGTGTGCALHTSISGSRHSEGSCRQPLRSYEERVGRVRSGPVRGEAVRHSLGRNSLAVWQDGQLHQAQREPTNWLARCPPLTASAMASDQPS